MTESTHAVSEFHARQTPLGGRTPSESGSPRVAGLYQSHHEASLIRKDENGYAAAGRTPTRLRSWLCARQSLSGGAATWGPRAAGRERMLAGEESVGFSRELDMALAGPQRGMKIANFRERGGPEVGQTSRSVQQATGQEAGPTRQQPFSGEGTAG